MSGKLAGIFSLFIFAGLLAAGQLVIVPMAGRKLRNTDIMENGMDAERSRQIASGLGLLLVMTLSLLVGWFAVSASDQIVEYAKRGAVTDELSAPALPPQHLKNR